MLVSAAGYYTLAYWVPRTSHLALFSLFGLLVFLGMIMYRLLPSRNWKVIFFSGLFFRLIFLFASPQLSDDFFRFTWDGELMRDGYSVFAFVPEDFEAHISPEHHDKYRELLSADNESFPNGMNSPGYHSIYPTVNQLVFFSVTIGNSPNEWNLVLMRLWLVLAEVITFFLLRSLLMKKSRDHWIAIYWWHPLIILELVGNLHFEGIAITFILATIYYAHKNRWLSTAVMASLAIMTKLTPVFLLGALFRQFTWKRWMLVSVVTCVLTLLLFRIIVDAETLSNFGKSADLFFNLFAFNSATYYGMLEIAKEWQLTKARETVAGILPWISVVLGTFVVFFQKRSMEWTLMLLFTIYFFFSPIVHPWYVTVLIPLALLTKTLYPLVWSVLIFGTYAAYGESYETPISWVYFEYIVVFLVFVFEHISGFRWMQELAALLYSKPQKETTE